MSKNIEKNLLKVSEMKIEDAEETAQIEAENFSKPLKQKDFEGGKIVTRGVADQEISLEWNQDAVPSFTEDQYRALCAKFSAEDFSIPDGDALSSPDQYKLSCVSVQKVK